MREIKFRAWDDISKVLYNWGDIDHIVLTNFINKEHYHLMQYTGLKDKNGKEIYEGDILKFDKENEAFYDTPYPSVWFSDASFCVSIEYDMTPLPLMIEDSKQCKIIGNIHENPEL